MQCSSIQGLYAQLTEEDLYIWYSSIQGIYAQLTGEDLYIWCSGIQGIYAQLTGEDVSLSLFLSLYICSVAVCKASMLD